MPAGAREGYKKAKRNTLVKPLGGGGPQALKHKRDEKMSQGFLVERKDQDFSRLGKQKAGKKLGVEGKSHFHKRAKRWAKKTGTSRKNDSSRPKGEGQGEQHLKSGKLIAFTLDASRGEHHFANKRDKN